MVIAKCARREKKTKFKYRRNWSLLIRDGNRIKRFSWLHAMNFGKAQQSHWYSNRIPSMKELKSICGLFYVKTTKNCWERMEERKNVAQPEKIWISHRCDAPKFMRLKHLECEYVYSQYIKGSIWQEVPVKIEIQLQIFVHFAFHSKCDSQRQARHILTLLKNFKQQNRFPHDDKTNKQTNGKIPPRSSNNCE